MEDVESTLLSNNKRKSSGEESSNSGMIVHDHNGEGMPTRDLVKVAGLDQRAA